MGSNTDSISNKLSSDVFDAVHLLSLPKHNVYLNLSIDGSTSDPFSAETSAPYTTDSSSNKEKDIANSREQYATLRRLVDDKISQ